MSIALVRAKLKPVIESANHAHAGLLIQRTLQVWETGEKSEKGKLINKIVAVESDDFYQLAFNRWQQLTNSQPNRFATLKAKVNGRLLTSLGTGGALETGASVHHTYGVPYISASSIKGAVRAYAENGGLDQKYIRILFGHGDEDNKVLSGGEKLDNTAGYLIWHDAWWIPKSVNKPFIKEIVTVHHQGYYSATQEEATDFDSPVPNQQIGVQGQFYFSVEGDQQWIQFAMQLLRNAIVQVGLGAKAASGYGYFELMEQATTTLSSNNITWEDAQLSYNKGSKILSAVKDKKTANIDKQDKVDSIFSKLSDGTKKKLNDKKTVRLKVKVKETGNMFTLLKVIE